MALVKYVVFHPFRAVTVLLVGIVVGLGSFYAYQVNAALGAVASEDFNPELARDAISATFSGPSASAGLDTSGERTQRIDDEMVAIDATLGMLPDEPGFNVAALGSPIPDEVFEAYLMVGTDASGFLADTIILALQPEGGGPPIMVSLPRDLFVWNICKSTFTRINTGLGGCGSRASGSELLAIMVEDYTGISIDHLARVNFDGFAAVIDAMGGIQVCLDHPRRDIKAHLSLESTGCQRLDGDEALAWVRSRHPEERVDGRWRALGGSDFGRQERQQDVLFQLAAKASNFSSPNALSQQLSAVVQSVRLDSSWTIGDAMSTAWRYRGLAKDDVSLFAIDVANYQTPTGAAVLLPTIPFRDQLQEYVDLD